MEATFPDHSPNSFIRRMIGEDCIEDSIVSAIPSAV